MITLERENIAVRQSASGNALQIPVFRLRSEKLGPKVYMQSSVHAAEVQGNVVILELMCRLQSNAKFRGEFVFVPFCNPYGMELRLGEFTYGRFDPSTGENWNRGYYDVHKDLDIVKFVHDLSGDLDGSLDKISLQESFRQVIKKLTEKQLKTLRSQGATYGKLLNMQLQALACDADIVLDFHCDTCSLPHVYTPAYLEQDAKELPVNYFVSFPNDFSGALDEAVALPWWTLREELRKQKKCAENELPKVEAYTVELGDMETISITKAKEQAAGILEYLMKRKIVSLPENNLQHSSAGVIKSDEATKYVVDLSDFQRIYCDSAGIVDFSVPLGTKLQAGDAIAQLISYADIYKTTDLESAVQDITAPEDCILLTHSGSAATHQHANILKVFRKYRAL